MGTILNTLPKIIVLGTPAEWSNLVKGPPPSGINTNKPVHQTASRTTPVNNSAPPFNVNTSHPSTVTTGNGTTTSSPVTDNTNPVTTGPDIGGYGGGGGGGSTDPGATDPATTDTAPVKPDHKLRNGILIALGIAIVVYVATRKKSGGLKSII